MRFISLLFLLLSISASGQPVDANQAQDGKFAPYMGQDFILYTHSTDTLFCDEVKALLEGPLVVELVFTVDGETSSITGQELQDVQAFYSQGKVMMELMPIDPSNPESPKLHRFKNLIGYFTVWTNNHRQAYWMQKSDRIPPRMTTSYALVSIEGGPVFNANENNAKKKILKPIFDECAGIQKTTTDMVAPMSFQILKMDIVDQCFDYNRLCAPNYGK
ncbi:MAG: hypothetical protein H6603_04710 [Flavobacteriales bacterium]|nr:hypothetical protein [Flavobacteriales bacterium]MCB9191256.1 hypothetical protein [Flavobacteriales bacterium]MCB9204261.1 hypothetical protein [Flavobacteriales bacterium]